MKSELNERDLMKNITVTIKVRRDWRVNFGLFIMRFGAWVSGCRFEVECYEDER